MNPVRLTTTVKVALLVSLSLVLFNLQVPLFAPYLRYDLSTVPALIAGFALGPAAGLAVVLVKNGLFLVLHFRPDELVGIPMRTLADATFVGVSACLYWKHKTRLRAALSLAAGVLSMALGMIPANLLVLPFFSWLFLDRKMDGGDLWRAVWTAVTPFNVAGGLVTSLVTFLVYKRFSRFLKSW